MRKEFRVGLISRNLITRKIEVGIFFLGDPPVESRQNLDNNIAFYCVTVFASIGFPMALFPTF